MKFKITIESIGPTKDADKYSQDDLCQINYTEKIYEQIVDSINLIRIIEAVNTKEPPMFYVYDPKLYDVVADKLVPK